MQQYRVAHKTSQICRKDTIYSKPRQNCFGNWITIYTLVTCHANDQKCYTDLLKTSLLCECRRLYPGNDFVFINTVLRHTTQKQHNSFYDRTLHTSSANEWASYSIKTVRKSIAQWKRRLTESRMEARFSTFSANHCDWILISCDETC